MITWAVLTVLCVAGMLGTGWYFDANETRRRRKCLDRAMQLKHKEGCE